MTTDITELAQSLKAAAKKATPGPWVALTDTSTHTFSVHTPDDKRCDDVIKWTGFDGQRKAKANAKFIALANPSNILALVEALEKAQGMEAYWKTQYRGITDHCEELQARIAELESRTVTVKLPAERFCPAEYAGSQLWSETEVWNKAITACADELRAAGIKVEAE